MNLLETSCKYLVENGLRLVQKKSKLLWLKINRNLPHLNLILTLKNPGVIFLRFLYSRNSERGARTFKTWTQTDPTGYTYTTEPGLQEK